MMSSIRPSRSNKLVSSGTAQRPGRFSSALGGGGKWGGGMASEGVMDCFEWDPKRATEASLASTEGCFDQNGQVFLFVHKWAVGHLCVIV